MNKKFLAVKLVLGLAASFGAVAADEKPLTGSWTNKLTLNPQTSSVDHGNDSTTLETAYASAIVYTSRLSFDTKGGEKYE